MNKEIRLKLKKIFTSNIFLISILTLAGLLIRIFCLNKPEGFWMDEMISCYTSAFPFPVGILNYLKDNGVHAPLYFFILHFWMKLFPSDFGIRLLSVIFGTAIIPIVYFMGLEFKSKKLAVLASTFVCVNSLLVYYSQEVRFYSLLTLFSTLSLFYILKFMNNPSKKNCLGLVLSNLGVLYTFTIGFVFVFFEALVLSIYLYLKDRKNLKKFLILNLITLILFLPYLGILMHHLFLPSNDLFLKWWNPFDISELFALLQSWFSPLLNIYTNISIADFYASEHIDYFATSLVVIILAVFFVINSLLKKDKCSLILLVGLLYLAVFLFQVVRGDMPMRPRYTLMILPVLLFAIAHSLLNLANKKAALLYIVAFVYLNAFYLLVMPRGAIKLSRAGYNSVALLLEQISFRKNDHIFITIPDDFPVYEFIHRYYKNLDSKNIINLSILGYLNTLPGEKFNNSDYKNKDEFLDKYRNYILSPEPSKAYEKYLYDNYIKKMKKGDHIVVIRYRSVFYQEPEITQEDFYRLNLFSLMQKKVYSDAFNVFSKYLQVQDGKTKDNWISTVFVKQ